MDIHFVEKELYDFLKRQEFYAEVYISNRNCLAVNIEWGDWKHEHLRCDYLLNEFCKMYNLICKSVETVVTDTDGSDCYSGIHYFRYEPKYKL